MIKILHYVGAMKRAGLETFIMNIYRNLNTDEFQFGFLCTLRDAGDYDDEILGLGGKMTYVDFDKGHSKFRHFKNYRILCDKLKNYTDEYDVFHIHHYHAFDAYLAAKAALDAGFKNVIVHSHSASTDGHFRLHKISRYFLSELPIVKMACSEESGKWMFSGDNITVVRNGIDTELYQYNDENRSKLRKEYAITDELVIGHVGRFDPVKNHLFLVHLFKEYLDTNPNAKLLLVGNGVERNNIIQLCEELDITSSVIFTGVRTDVASLYQMMDMYIMPSIYEGVSLTAIEAECSGLPCVFSDTVANDVDIRHNVKHCSLDSQMEVWIKTINDLKGEDNIRDNAREDIVKAGYDIRTCAEFLMNKYKELTTANKRLLFKKGTGI